ncbi:MAG: putative DNA binding domain-containing protein [Planctomycetes bacterium]|nr:putative DNA binding domain-containing protein [Planctomycetota bacterium]
MTSDRPVDYLVSLVRELCKLVKETGWLEFKVDKAEPQEIGEYISALANSAALTGKAFAYLVWGVADADHAIVGTNFVPGAAKVGNEELENWLLRLLTPKIQFRFFEVSVDGHSVVVLEIERASRHPVQFQGQEFLRIGSYKKRLKDFPEKERELWRIFDRTPFEESVAAERVDDADVLRLLDYPAYFDLLERPLPANGEGILAALADDRLIRRSDAGGWDITHLGAMLFAKRLDDFRTLYRKVVRVVHYRGNGRTQTLKEQEGAKGYACGFKGLLEYINGLLPANEVIGQALRKSVPMFPEPAVRELVANALIHQDFFVTGAGPMVEIFDDRIEITNPGEPLVDTQRFVDAPPRSRNEALASLMRRFRICEERGSGIDKVVFQVELFQLPAPLFESPEGFTRTVLFAHKPLAAMNKTDRVRACYLHACLCYVMRRQMTNASLRQRLGIADQNIATASRLLGEAVEAGVIVVADPEAGTRIRSYLPSWAAPKGEPGGVA